MPLIRLNSRPDPSTLKYIRNAYFPVLPESISTNLHAITHHWYDTSNQSILAEQSVHRLLSRGNFHYLHQLMRALDVPLKYERDFRRTLLHFNGSLSDFLTYCENNATRYLPEDFEYEYKTKPQAKHVKKHFGFSFKKIGAIFSRLKKCGRVAAQKISDLFTFQPNEPFTIDISDKFRAKKARILAYRKEYIKQHHAMWRNVAISLPLVSLWAWGYRQVVEPTTADNDNVAKTEIVQTPNKYNLSAQKNGNNATIASLSKSSASNVIQLANNASKTVSGLLNSTSQLFQSNPFTTKNSALNDGYSQQLTAQKDKDLAEFARIYRQCSYSNYVKLSNGYKTSTFRAANRSLKKHGIKPLHPRLYCAGMSIASLCQAQDIFKQKRPDSYIIPAIDEILKNCHNIHHCATLKKDLKKITNSYSYSSDPTKDIKNYMQTHKNAIVFLWTPRGGGNFHHQTLFNNKTSNNLYTYSSFNRQRWGNQDDFQGFMDSRSKHGNSCYFTDFAEGIDNIATKYIQKDVQKHQFDLAQNTFAKFYYLKQMARS